MKDFLLFWAQVTLSNLSNVNFPAVHWGGWFDIFLQPMLWTYDNYQTKSAIGAKGKQQLFIGPRGHCELEDYIWFPDDRLVDIWAYEQSVRLFLTQDDSETSRKILPSLPKAHFDAVTLYVMGPDPSNVIPTNVTGMYWTTIPDFPKPTPMKLFLTPNNQLSPKAPQQSSKLAYVYDPDNPVPTVGGNNLFISCGPLDQTEIENRDDVLLFTSEPFAVDTPVVGKIQVTLQVSSNCTDTDFTVKVTDVYPVPNISTLITDNIQRMRWRNSDSVPSLMIPHTVYKIDIDLWETCYIFNKGHRLRLAVSSSNYPRFSANYNNGLMVHQGGPKLKALNSVHMGGLQLSSITLPVVSLQDIPNNVLT